MRVLTLSLLLALAVVLGACSGEDAATDFPTVGAATAEAAGDASTVDLTLSGANEVPGPGADGEVPVTLTIADGEACLTGDGAIGAIGAGHIHTGTAEESGGVLVDLGVSSEGDGPFEGCGPITPEQEAMITDDPAGFYVNLHTGEFPDGAVRAQVG